MTVDRLEGSRGRAFTPQAVDELLARHDLVGPQGQQGEQKTLLGGAECDRPRGSADLERAEEHQLHGESVRPAGWGGLVPSPPVHHRAATGQAHFGHVGNGAEDTMRLRWRRDGQRLDGRSQAAALGNLPMFSDCSGAELRVLDTLLCEARVPAGRVLAGRGSLRSRC